MVDPVKDYGMKSRIGKHNLKAASRSRIPLEYCAVIALDVRPKTHICRYYTSAYGKMPLMNRADRIDLIQLIADYMENGFLENIVDMFLHDSSLYELVGTLIQDERVRVRLGITALMEELARKDPGHVQLVLQGLLPLLSHDNAVVRGDAANLIGITGDRCILQEIEKLRTDTDPNVRLIVDEAISELRSRPLQ